MPTGRVTLRFGDREHVVDVMNGPDRIEARIDDATFRVAVEGNLVRVEGSSGGPAWVVSAGDSRWVYHDGCVSEIEVAREGGRRRTSHPGSLSAPMPATVRQIRVAVGDAVARGDTVIVLEAMKMELPVRSNADGIVSAVRCREGELVQPGLPLIEIAETTGA
jgi:acetyl/propionyl-CoA carboxylase alpha subunit